MPKSKQVRHKPLKPIRFAPLFTDWAFKNVFGKPGGELLLIALLNDFLKRVLPAPITKIKYLPIESLGATPKSKKVIFDILCEDKEKNVYLIEMQNAKLKNAGNRWRLYISRVQAEMVGRGVKSYAMPASFFIGILNYKRDDSKFFFTEEGWFNLQTKQLASKKEFRVFVELPKFEKVAAECHCFRDKIVFLFKNLHKISERPANFKEKFFDRLFEVSEIAKLGVRDLKILRSNMRYIDERQLAIDCAVEEAVEEATEAALVQGIKQGLLRSAKSMLKRGFEPTLVANITKLPKKQVMALR
ncbi:MAG: Rpn family recombination-promoting nuclease/putative transposase [Bacteroidales bacterium]|jgi:predicted transposase/invertase (TIGR01784 family)|nr:Rpn family recombination-promoting nuclease/putative transposase [Bacteroidales bacterium]